VQLPNVWFDRQVNAAIDAFRSCFSDENYLGRLCASPQEEPRDVNTGLSPFESGVARVLKVTYTTHWGKSLYGEDSKDKGSASAEMAAYFGYSNVKDHVWRCYGGAEGKLRSFGVRRSNSSLPVVAFGVPRFSDPPLRLNLLMERFVHFTDGAVKWARDNQHPYFSENFSCDARIHYPWWSIYLLKDFEVKDEKRHR